jgi:hypothetical protein
MSSSTFSRSDCTSSTCSIALRRSPGARASPDSRSRGGDESPRSSGLESRPPPPRPPRPPRRPPRNRGRRESDRRCPSLAAGAAGFSPAGSGWPSGCSSGFICTPTNFRFSTIKINGINDPARLMPNPSPKCRLTESHRDLPNPATIPYDHLEATARRYDSRSPFELAIPRYFVLVSNMTFNLPKMRPTPPKSGLCRRGSLRPGCLLTCAISMAFATRHFEPASAVHTN